MLQSKPHVGLPWSGIRSWLQQMLVVHWFVAFMPQANGATKAVGAVSYILHKLHGQARKQEGAACTWKMLEGWCAASGNIMRRNWASCGSCDRSKPTGT